MDHPLILLSLPAWLDAMRWVAEQHFQYPPLGLEYVAYRELKDVPHDGLAFMRDETEVILVAIGLAAPLVAAVSVTALLLDGRWRAALLAAFGLASTILSLRWPMWSVTEWVLCLASVVLTLLNGRALLAKGAPRDA